MREKKGTWAGTKLTDDNKQMNNDDDDSNLSSCVVCTAYTINKNE